MNQQNLNAPATSSTTIIFLGDREMPITRDNHTKQVNVTVIGDDRVSSSEQACTCSRSPPDSVANNHSDKIADDETIVKVISRQNSVGSEHKTVRYYLKSFIII